MTTAQQLFGSASSRAVDAQATATLEDGGLAVSGYELMQRAAAFALTTLVERYPNCHGISIFCGKGNNAGDGYVVAYMAKQMGLEVQTVAVCDSELLQGDARIAYENFCEQGLSIDSMPTEIKYPVLVDALLGTGCRGPLRSPFDLAVQQINQHTGPVVSLDLPSGIDADTGAGLSAVRSDLTISFITRKLGLYTGDGIAAAGERCFSDLGVPAKILAAHPSLPLFTWQPEQMPRLKLDTYKSRQGHIVIVGGASTMGGATILAAKAAFRAGAGLVTVVCHGENKTGLLAQVPEAMWADPAGDECLDLMAQADVLLLGPGLGRDHWAEDILRRAPRRTGPCLVDADGLYWLANRPALRDEILPAPEQLFITPHAGEAARLLTKSVQEINADRTGSALELSAIWRCSGVLKGPGSVVFSHAGELSICAHGNPGMATAGMGDVLAGIASALLPSFGAQAAQRGFCQAVALHSASADAAVQVLGQRSLMATDVIECLPANMVVPDLFNAQT